MVSNSFSVFSTLFGFVVSLISLFALLINTCRSHLPNNRIKELEELMDGTEAFFEKAVEEGLLVEPGFVEETTNDLKRLRRKTRNLQTRVLKATTLCEDYLELLKGTSTRIGHTCRDLKRLRAQVISSSEKGRVVIEQLPFHRPSDPVRVLQYFKEGVWMADRVASLKGIHLSSLHEMTRTYAQLMDKIDHKLYIRQSSSSRELE